MVQVTTIDQSTAVVGDEPLKSMRSFRYHHYPLQRALASFPVRGFGHKQARCMPTVFCTAIYHDTSSDT